MTGNDDSLSASDIPWETWRSDPPPADLDETYLRLALSHDDLVEYALSLQEDRRVIRRLFADAIGEVARLVTRVQSLTAQIKQLRHEYRAVRA